LESGSLVAFAKNEKDEMRLVLFRYIPPHFQMNRSNRSFLTLQMGQISGGPSLAHRYPQTLHLQTGYGSETGPVRETFWLSWSLSSRGGRRSGIERVPFSPLATASET
jgi:hypothetical protein